MYDFMILFFFFKNMYYCPLQKQNMTALFLSNTTPSLFVFPVSWLFIVWIFFPLCHFGPKYLALYISTIPVATNYESLIDSTSWILSHKLSLLFIFYFYGELEILMFLIKSFVLYWKRSPLNSSRIKSISHI